MQERILSVFVDESGRFLHPDPASRFYIIGMVLHDQAFDIRPLVDSLDSDWTRMGLSGHCFHAGPLIRKEKGYAYLNWEFRNRIFFRMMAFARKAEFRHHCLVVDKNYVSSSDQIVSDLERELTGFLSDRVSLPNTVDRVKIYYDCGQTPVTNLLHRSFGTDLAVPVEFAKAVRPERYKLFQLADLVCSVKLVQVKLDAGLGMTESEKKFFGGPRLFKRNVLKPLRAKEI